MSTAEPPPGEEQVRSRAASLRPEEERAGSDDPEAQAAAVLADSEERTLHPGAAPGTVTEHVRSEDSAASP